eukprot:CAMPEP_0115872298 /NCGR_PEP_ID=MMETSP0287-20121206/23345_1 /TAXON_ID=412157 /ORGANISM="Chrysochromulina rotalis, Strain UIO044" /LENGTH=45 /DNA_ID= /DNA_START= /DNA_END= /DNA_ORIENTATION=
MPCLLCAQLVRGNWRRATPLSEALIAGAISCRMQWPVATADALGR